MDTRDDPLTFHPLSMGDGIDHLAVAFEERFGPDSHQTPPQASGRHRTRTPMPCGRTPLGAVCDAAIGWGAVGIAIGMLAYGILEAIGVAQANPVPLHLAVGLPAALGALAGAGKAMARIARRARILRDVEGSERALDTAALSQHAAQALRALRPTLPQHPEAAHLSCTACWNARPEGMALVSLVVWLHDTDGHTTAGSTSLPLHALPPALQCIPFERCTPGTTPQAWARMRAHLMPHQMSTRAVPYASAHQRMAAAAAFLPTCWDGQEQAPRLGAT